ncbi:glycerophosphodiester phosphodiesterase [Roseibium marinum]|uniref:Glycerophosphoryl diester phosphodiesterase family protein n=1 Tax=Roseibium marinum TaxID=281252 RepID=A0A2S3UKW6_9HYPH|nr:glycerophosphodiester phosphodiesterase family protein [Roseibium marinum]POF28129.1 glycerophosphoryl diester phosphodiesterase family protein [Roseibium marinum]
MSHFLDTCPHTLVCAHRGHSIDGHENSIHALDLAAKYGAEVCEIDIRRSADGVMVVFHDTGLNQTSTGEGAVSDHDWETLSGLRHRLRGSLQEGASLSRLEEILDHARSLEMNLVIELKDDFDDTELRHFFSMLEERDMQDAVMISSFDHGLLVRIRELNARIRTFGIVHAHLIDPVALARNAGFSGVTLDFPITSLKAAGALKAAGIAPSHYLNSRNYFTQTGKRGQEELGKVIDVIRTGDLKILFCDDVPWGVEVRNAKDLNDVKLSRSPVLEAVDH